MQFSKNFMSYEYSHFSTRHFSSKFNRSYRIYSPVGGYLWNMYKNIIVLVLELTISLYFDSAESL